MDPCSALLTIAVLTFHKINLEDNPVASLRTTNMGGEQENTVSLLFFKHSSILKEKGTVPDLRFRGIAMGRQGVRERQTGNEDPRIARFHPTHLDVEVCNERIDVALCKKAVREQFRKEAHFRNNPVSLDGKDPKVDVPWNPAKHRLKLLSLGTLGKGIGHPLFRTFP